MPLTKSKLTDMWKAGYCRDTVEHAATTDDSPRGSTERVEWLQEHVPGCAECEFANRLKMAEWRVAKKMGPRSEAEFIMGHDITKLPSYDSSLLEEELKLIMLQLEPERGADFLEWMSESAQRGRWRG